MSAGTILAIACGAFYSFMFLSDSKVKIRTLTWACAGLIALATLCLLAAQSSFGDVPAHAAFGLASAGAIACAVAGGITITELYASLQPQPSANTSGQLWLVYWFVLPSLFWAPDRLGQAQSARDAHPQSSPLPKVELADPGTQDTWRLIHLHEGRGLLVRLGEKPEDRIFKLVDAKDIKFISYASLSPTAN
ncbi:hypothetical protein PL263_10100 [Methylomonas sp. EFPC3]|uniref:hypothetical protein n=1 Tax=Methylomonas sp. EFPC3 TaxID=3021710 RepID=UPI0024174B8B|nr:hypothetical protein [Methylomonas sp. EFPC3]WFP48469.1 hypothetical protein PL263_10100 [Methylomonas sp. EFPC3]